jgi:hypothetical protein
MARRPLQIQKDNPLGFGEAGLSLRGGGSPGALTQKVWQGQSRQTDAADGKQIAPRNRCERPIPAGGNAEHAISSNTWNVPTRAIVRSINVFEQAISRPLHE